MLPQVLLECAGVDACVVAPLLGALDVQHAGVDPHVRAQLVLPRERFLAQLARERLLT